MAASTVIETISNQVQDELPRIVHEAFPALDPVYKYIDQTFIGVELGGGDDISYKWQVNHLFSSGLAGRIIPASPYGQATLSNNYYTPMKFLNTTLSTPFPAALTGAHAGVSKRTLALHMNTGNMAIPTAWMQYDKLSAAHIKQVGMDIKALGEQRALLEAVSFFSDRSYGSHVLGKCAISGCAAGASDYEAVITVTGGRIGYFRPGMMVDLLADSSGPQYGAATDGTDVLNTSYNAGAYVPIVITAVDFLAKTITVAATDGTTKMTTASGGIGGTGHVAVESNTAAFWIVLGYTGQDTNQQYWPLVSWGLEDWIKSSGILFQTGLNAGGVNLSNATLAATQPYQPQFKSQVVAVSAALTDTVLNSYVGGYIDAYGDAAPDTILTTWGVTLKYIQAPNASGLDRMLFERTGKALSVHGGFSEVEFSFNGRNMKWMISSLCLPGYLYGLKFRDGNVKRYVPPRLGGSDDRIGSEVEFLAPVTGLNGIFMPMYEYTTAAPVAAVQMPFWQYRLIAPIDVRAIKLTGLTEATMV